MLHNAVFEKTMENVTKYSDIKLLITEARRNSLVSEPNYHRPSQIVCMFTIVYVTCTQIVLHALENLCRVLIPLCKNNLNVQVCWSFSSASCLVTSSFHSLWCHARFLLRCTRFFCLFLWTPFCSTATPQTSLSQSNNWFPFILKHF